MATQLQIRRGTSAQVAAFTGAEGEVVVNTTNDSIHVNDGSTAGGFELARVDGSNWAITNAISTTANISFGDNDKAIFGAGSDLTIFSDGGTFSYINNTQGVLRIRNTSDDQDVAIQSDNGSGGVTDYFLADGSSGAVKLYNYGSQKLATTSTGIDVTGSVVSDGLTVDGTANFNSNNVVHTAATPNYVLSESDVTDENTQFLQASGTLRIRTVNDAGTNVAERLRIDHGTGDISFYNSSGTSQSLHWDSSAESLGIGTTSPAFAAGSGIEIEQAGTATLRLQDTTNAANGEIRSGPSGIEFFSGAYGTSGDPFSFSVSGTTALTIDSSRNVGIGTSSPSDLLDISANGTSAMRLSDSSSPATYAQFTQANGVLTFAADAGNAQTGSNMQFEVDGSEAMRISGGNLLVGKTSTTFGTVGVENRADGRITSTRSGNTNLLLNRLSSDGDIVQFYKDGSTAGSIGTIASDLYIGEGNSGLRFDGENNQILPSSTTASTDGTCNLGAASARFKDLYLSGGVLLGGTGSANKLDDYEEGTWTPVLKRNGSTNNATITINGAVYVKIGRMVHVSFYLSVIDYSAVTDGTNATITGLPFSATGSTWFSGSIGYGTSTNASDTTWVVSGSNGYFLNTNNNGFRNGTVDLNRGMFTITYQTT